MTNSFLAITEFYKKKIYFLDATCKPTQDVFIQTSLMKMCNYLDRRFFMITAIKSEAIPSHYAIHDELIFYSTSSHYRYSASLKIGVFKLQT